MWLKASVVQIRNDGMIKERTVWEINMKMEEYLQLSAREMLDVIKTDPEYDYHINKEAVKAFANKLKAESIEREKIRKKKMIEQFGFYDPDFHIDPLPRKRVEKK